MSMTMLDSVTLPLEAQIRFFSHLHECHKHTRFFKSIPPLLAEKDIMVSMIYQDPREQHLMMLI